jgi:hypothetical protein
MFHWPELWHMVPLVSGRPREVSIVSWHVKFHYQERMETRQIDASPPWVTFQPGVIDT